MKFQELNRQNVNWSLKKIKDIGRVITGKTPPTKISHYWRNEIPFITPGDIQDTKYINKTMRKVSRKGAEYLGFILPKNSISVVCIGSIGKIGLIYEESVTNQQINSIICNEEICPSFIYYSLLEKSKRLTSISGSNVLPILKKSLFENFRIPLPPLPEQKKIAEILSTVDLAIEKYNDAIKKIDELRKGLAAKLFSQGIGHQKFKKTILGKIPYEWEIQKLDSLLELCQYGLSIKMDLSGKYPIIKMNSIKNGRVIHENLKYVNLKSKEFQKYKLKKGDILFNRTNSYELVGRTGVFTLEGDYVFASYLIRLRVIDKQISSYFLALYLIFKNDQLRQMATRAVHQANINATNLKGFSVLVPSLKEQKEITEIFNSIDKKMELLQAKKEKLTSIKKGLMNDLLTGKKRVRLVS